MIEIDEIQILVNRIAQDFKPQAIILFGSYAVGQPDIDSDVDLLVIMPYLGKRWKVASKIRRKTRPSFPIDLLIRSPEELKERLAMGDVLLHEITQQGKVLYEAKYI